MPKRSPLYFALLGVFLFFGFGLFHLAKFETTDEHFWKYERITKYFQGISEGIRSSVWKNTRINDKPGVTVALVSGLGLPFIQNPKLHRDREAELSSDNVFTIYQAEQTEQINFALRLPLLLFNTIFLFFFFWVFTKITDSRWIAASATLFIATSPILVGISQVINPDALLWSFGTASFFSYVALLKTKERKFIPLSGILLGFALLSKYTGNILFLFSFLFLFAHLLFSEKTDRLVEVLRKQYFHLFIITLTAWATFSLLMPAVIQKPKHFLFGTLFSPVLKPLLLPLGISIVVLLSDLIFFHARGTRFSLEFFKKYAALFLRIPAGIMLFLIVFALINAWSGAPFFSLEDIKEQSYFGKELVFAQISSDNGLVRGFLGLSIQSQNIIFSLPPLFLMILCGGWLSILFGKWRPKIASVAIITIAPLVFFGGGLIADVFVNPRYAILLYPLLAFFGALSLAAIVRLILERYPAFKENIAWAIVCGGILMSGFITLWFTKPFYLTYESFLLPREYVVSDSWGYGSYEAAAFLNTLPDAESLVIWSDRSAVCQFFIGKCIRDYKIDLDKSVPDYFVFSRRGSLRHPFIWDNRSSKSPAHSSGYYYEKIKGDPTWTFIMNGRTDDFVTVISAEER
jgi:4-amino-4-deoxy-L-arabinose transferase-like glycosyltransferase